MRHSLRSKTTGQFIPRKRPIISGHLYGYRGAVVRAHRLAINGIRHVSFHKQLHGFVKDSELQWINCDQVKQYLEAA